MNYSEKLINLYEKISTTLSDQYNYDYLTVTEAFDSLTIARSKQQIMQILDEVANTIDNEDIHNLYENNISEFARSISVAKGAMLDINLFCQAYATEPVFNVNANTNAVDILKEVNDLFSELAENKELKGISINDITEEFETDANIHYEENSMNINWDSLIMIKYSELIKKHEENYISYEYDPETDELSVIENDELEI